MSRPSRHTVSIEGDAWNRKNPIQTSKPAYGLNGLLIRLPYSVSVKMSIRDTCVLNLLLSEQLGEHRHAVTQPLDRVLKRRSRHMRRGHNTRQREGHECVKRTLTLPHFLG
jgi:hypothetical protein